MTRVVIAAGEPSGDRHAGHLITELRNRLPNLSVFGMGVTLPEPPEWSAG